MFKKEGKYKSLLGKIGLRRRAGDGGPSSVGGMPTGPTIPEPQPALISSASPNGHNTIKAGIATVTITTAPVSAPPNLNHVQNAPPLPAVAKPQIEADTIPEKASFRLEDVSQRSGVRTARQRNLDEQQAETGPSVALGTASPALQQHQAVQATAYSQATSLSSEPEASQGPSAVPETSSGSGFDVFIAGPPAWSNHEVGVSGLQDGVIGVPEKPLFTASRNNAAPCNPVDPSRLSQTLGAAEPSGSAAFGEAASVAEEITESPSLEDRRDTGTTLNEEVGCSPPLPLNASQPAEPSTQPETAAVASALLDTPELPKKMATIHDVPAHILQLALAYLPDISSLIHAALSCRTLFVAVSDAMELLATQILSKQMPTELLPDAFVAVKSSYLEPRLDDLDALSSFTATYLSQRKLEVRVNLTEAKNILQLHAVVDFFAKAHLAFGLRELKDEAWRWRNVGGGSAASSPPSNTEYARSVRSFYLFEIYRNMFKNLTSVVPEAQRDASELLRAQRRFFDCFAPWEIEQLSAVVDFLACAVIAPGLQHVCSNYSKWFDLFYGGPSRPDISPIGTRAVFQYSLLRHGLPFLSDLARTPTNRFYKVVKLPKTPELFALREMVVFLDNALTTCSFRTGDRRSDYPARPLRAIFKAFFPDGDSGPIRAWKWSYLHPDGNFEPGDTLVNAPSRRPCRRLMLVLWDEQRLARTLFMDNLRSGEWLSRHRSDELGTAVWDSGVEVPLIFGQGYHEDYPGPIFADPGSIAAGYNFPDEDVSYRYY